MSRFQSAKKFLLKEELEEEFTSVQPKKQKTTFSEDQQQQQESGDFVEVTIILTIVGLNHYRNDSEETGGCECNMSEVEIRLLLDKDNLIHPHAIAAVVFENKMEKKKILGYVAAKEANILAEFGLADSIENASTYVEVVNVDDYHVTILARFLVDEREVDVSLLQTTLLSVQQHVPDSSLSLASHNLSNSKKWVKELHSWEDDGNSKWGGLPPDEVRQMLGLATFSDTAWYGEFGLTPPDQWEFSGSLSILLEEHETLNNDDTAVGKTSIAANSDGKQIGSKDDTESGVFGVTGQWKDEFIIEVESLLSQKIFSTHSGTPINSITRSNDENKEEFLSRTKKDQLISVFGHSYVLGQSRDQLKLVRSRPHNDVTNKLCRAKDIIYAVVFGKYPEMPGFNTLIFGLCYRGAGFGYHRDQIIGLVGKEVTMIPNQPVATTILYEISIDSGKDSVFWIPLTKSSSSRWNDSYENPYKAKVFLPTLHLMEHLQKEGLQEKSKHGIFTTPPELHCYGKVGEIRKGMRIAITSRVSSEKSEELVDQLIEEGKVKYVKIIDCNQGDMSIAWTRS